MKKLKISKEEYCKMVKAIQEYDKENNEFSKCFEKFSDTYYICTLGQNLANKTIELLCKLTGDSAKNYNDSWLSWWLYESVEKKIYNDIGEETDVSSIEDLYDYLATE